MKSHTIYLKKSVFLLFLSFVSAFGYAQSTSPAYQKLMQSMDKYIQQELYSEVSKVLFDVEEAPAVDSYIGFSKGVKSNLDQIVSQNSAGLEAKEEANAKLYTQAMMIQLGELYMERAQELEPKEKIAFLDAYLSGIGLDKEINALSDDLARSLMMSLHSAMGIPFGVPNYQIENYIESLPEPKQELYRAAMILNETVMLSGGYEVAERQVTEFQQLYPKSGFLPQLQRGLASLEKLREGAVVENFAFEDMEGNKVSLADYKDKIIYLDLWASWCGPCINTFRTKTPAFEQKLRERDDVVLMYVSIDEKPEAWKNYLSKNPMRGVHLFAGKGFEAEIVRYFKVWGIPRYLILGKDNKIIDVNAPRPGDEAYEALIQIGGI